MLRLTTCAELVLFVFARIVDLGIELMSDADDNAEMLRVAAYARLLMLNFNLYIGILFK